MAAEAKHREHGEDENGRGQAGDERSPGARARSTGWRGGLGDRRRSGRHRRGANVGGGEGDRRRPCRFRGSRRRRGPEDVEQAAVGRLHVEHRRPPLHLEAVDVEKGPRRGQRGVGGKAGGDVAVEVLGEQDRGAIGDGELHGHHGRNAPADQPLREAAERISVGDRGAEAAVEKHEPERLQVVSQQRRQPAPVERLGGPGEGVALQVDKPLLPGESAVADEVEDVGSVVDQRAVEAVQRRVLQGHRRDRVGGGDLRQLGVESRQLLADPQLGVVAGRRHRDEQPQRRLDLQGRWRLPEVEPADQGHLDGAKDEVFRPAVVGELPGEAGHLGRVGRVDEDAETLAGLRSDLPQALLEAAAKAGREQGVVERRADQADARQRGQLGREAAAGVDHPRRRRPEPGFEVAGVHVHVGAGAPGGRCLGHLDRIFSALRRLEPQFEPVVGGRLVGGRRRRRARVDDRRRRLVSDLLDRHRHLGGDVAHRAEQGDRSRGGRNAVERGFLEHHREDAIDRVLPTVAGDLQLGEGVFSGGDGIRGDEENKQVTVADRPPDLVVVALAGGQIALVEEHRMAFGPQRHVDFADRGSGARRVGEEDLQSGPSYLCCECGMIISEGVESSDPSRPL